MTGLPKYPDIQLKVGEGFQIADIGLQHHANAITLDVDLGNVLRNLGTREIDPIGYLLDSSVSKTIQRF